jgi:very-short-patch-repair endonuclease
MEQEIGFREKLLGQFQKWSDELADLSGRNLLIAFKSTKRSTLNLSEDHAGLAQLYRGDDVWITQLVDLKKNDGLLCAKELLKIAVENEAQLGIQTLFLIQGLVQWKQEEDKIIKSKSILNAPIVIFPLKLKQIKSHQRYQLALDPNDLQINPFLLYYLKQFGIDPSEDEIIQLQSQGYAAICEWLDQEMSAHADIEIQHTFFIRNISYHKLPMVNDLKHAVEPMSKHAVISALAGDSQSKSKLKSKATEVNLEEPNEILSTNEHLILDADASQNLVINAALKGNDLVIEGPPGTGKSQTIANLIAVFLAEGKKVLFVAEKRAAIDAVYRRLKACGLEDVVTDLHEIAEARKTVPQQMNFRLNQLNELKEEPIFSLKNPLDDLKQQLNAQIKCLHQVHESGMSYYDLMNHLIAIENPDEFYQSPFRIQDLSPEIIQKLSFNEIEQEIKLSIKNLLVLESFKLQENFPFEKAMPKFKNAELVINLIQRLDILKSNLLELKNWLDEFHQFLIRSGLSEKEFKKLENLEEVFQLQAILDRLEHYTLDFNQSFFALDLSQIEGLKQQLRPLEQNAFMLFLYKQFNSDFKNALIRMSGYLNPNLLKEKNGIDSMILKEFDQFAQIKSELNDLLMMKNPKGTAIFYESLLIKKTQVDTKELYQLSNFQLRDPSILKLIDKIQEHLSLMNMDIQHPISPRKKLTEIIDQLEELSNWRSFLVKIPKILEDMQVLKSKQLYQYFFQVLKRSPLRSLALGKRIFESIQYIWLKRHEENFRLRYGDLINLTAEERDLLRQSFKEQDQEHIKQQPLVILQKVNHLAKQVLKEHNNQQEIILSQAIRKRGHLPIRQLVQKSSQVMLALRPCWMMSPLAVSQVLPPESYFDLVIFDEASQIVPADAIASLLRAQQVIVAGDSKQLSPTSSSFFSRKDDAQEIYRDQEEEDDWDENQILETESLLQAIKNILPHEKCVKTLRWHYRSEDERLIAFSNQHPDLYQGKLITMPSVLDQSPFYYHFVEDDDPKALSGKSPSAEVLYTAKLALETLKLNPALSLAIIAFGAEHARRIEDAFYDQLKHYPNLSLYPEGRPDEIFVVRHLENIQGDERDLTILSTGYGRNPKTNEQSYHFGALNRSENHFGIRRLNVAITRARKAMMVVTTIDVDQIDDQRLKTPGARALIEYLKFCRSGGKDLGILSFVHPSASQIAKYPMNPFEKDIYRALTARGLQLVPQVGISGYRLDFAVLDPNDPNRYLMAIEADGASYHAIPTVRDRDRIRGQHLEKLGWRFHRIWSTAWFKHREDEINRAVQAYEKVLESQVKN